MIHFISRYFYEYQRNRQYWMTRAEKKRAVMFVCGIVACVIVLVLIWMK